MLTVFSLFGLDLGRSYILRQNSREHKPRCMEYVPELHVRDLIVTLIMKSFFNQNQETMCQRRARFFITYTSQSASTL